MEVGQNHYQSLSQRSDQTGVVAVVVIIIVVVISG